MNINVCIFNLFISRKTVKFTWGQLEKYMLSRLYNKITTLASMEIRLFAIDPPTYTRIKTLCT